MAVRFAGAAAPIVLLGFMGCGKSTVGRVLGQRLGWRFCDLDDCIEAAAGTRIADIFAQRGEPAYRDLEHRELLNALGAAALRPTVLALGGGTYAQARNWAPIRAAGARTVFLDVPIEELLLRCAAMGNRPLFRDEASFRALHAERLPAYRQAQHTVVAGADAPAAVADRIMAALGAAFTVER